ncbi:MAG: hypothetical protein JEZ09_07170 [Salinivirgaceae bacterium]|nr:hypothetical protein [Salinivirgaceae bacterium]
MKTNLLKRTFHYVSSYQILVVVFVFLASSCQNKKTEVSDNYAGNIETNKLYKGEQAKNEAQVSYSFYLPSNYNGVDKLPVIFFFDPHANAAKAINKYKKLADTYGYVFIGSENIKNGMSAVSSKDVFSALLLEVKARFVIDEKRLFTAGFSGGAKLAIIYAQEFSDIIGVIACGASLPMLADYNPNYYYVGIVGNEDFNYLETHQTFTVFDKKGFDFTSVIFNGGHDWPPTESFDLAMAGLEIYAIKTKREEKNEAWLENLYVRMQDSMQVYEAKGDYLKEYQTIRQAVRWFYGISPVKELIEKSTEIGQKKELYTQMQKLQMLIQKEVMLRSEFVKAIENKDFEWWKLEVNKINTAISKGEENLAMVSQRLMNYVSMASFMLIKTNLDDEKLDEAFKKIKIYELVDPKNHDVYLMYARYYLLLNDVENMKKNYQKAVELGFTEKEEYTKESSWEQLMNHQEILKLQ